MNRPRPPWTVIVVDDSPEFLKAASTWMATRPEFRVVGTAADGAEALDRVGRIRPDLVLMDARMPLMDGFEATRRLKGSPDAPWIVIVSLHDSQAARREAWIAGADGFVSKADLTETLPDLVRGLASGAGSPAVGSPEAGGTTAADGPDPSGRPPRAKGTENGVVERRGRERFDLFGLVSRLFGIHTECKPTGGMPVPVTSRTFGGPNVEPPAFPRRGR